MQTFSAYNFFGWTFLHFFSTDLNSASNFAFYDDYIEFLKRKYFLFTLALFANLKPNADKPAQKNEKRILYMYHRIPYYIKILSGRLHFVKKIKIAVPYCTWSTLLIFKVNGSMLLTSYSFPLNLFLPKGPFFIS